MEVILIFRQPEPHEIIHIEQKLRSGGHRAVITPGISYPGTVTNPESLPVSLIRKSGRDLLDAILTFGDRRAGDTTVGELLNPGFLPLWHYQRFRIYYRLKPLYLMLSAIHHYLAGGDTVTVYCDAGSRNQLGTADDRVRFAEGKIPPEQPLNMSSLFAYLVYFLLRVCLDIVFPPKLRGKEHVIVDRSVRQRCRHPETLSHRIDNYTLSNLLHKSGKDFLIISETETPKLRGGKPFSLSKGLFAGNGRRSRSISGELLLLRGVITPELYRERKKLISGFNAGMNRLGEEDLDLTERLILDAFKGLAPTNRYFITRFLAYRRFFRKRKMVTVSAIDENSPATRCILDAARSTGAKSVGIQHGNIGDAQPAYLYTTLDRQNRVMADITLVWGDYWRDFLIRKGNFPEGSVIVTGQVRTDIIPVLKARPDLLKEEFSATRPLAVFASQPIPDPVLRRKAAEDVFAAFAKLPGYELIVKLHPAEKEAIGYYRSIALSVGCDDYRLLYDVDLYSLLAVSDLVITCYSTVGTEAVYFGKPLIIHDPLKEDLLGYYKAGVAWQVVNSDDIVQVAGALLKKEIGPDLPAMERFIGKYAYRIDGQACDRTLSILRGVKSGVSR